MEYFRSGLKTVLGGQQPGTQPTGAETVSLIYISCSWCFRYIHLLVVILGGTIS